jgi:hypothetical protein
MKLLFLTLRKISDVDFSYDERNPLLGSIRQVMPMIKCFSFYIDNIKTNLNFLLNNDRPHKIG